MRKSHFSADGAAQLRHDAGALLALFAPFTSRPQASFRRLDESCKVLTLPAARRTELLDLLLEVRAPPAASDPPPFAGSPTAADSTAVRVASILETEGVYRLGAGEVRELLASVVQEES